MAKENPITKSIAERYKQPEYILCQRACAHCADIFDVSKRYPRQRFCSRKCGFKALNPPDHQIRVSRATGPQRAIKMRAVGDINGRSYRKVDCRHEHRTVAEKKLGRPLKSNEIVHHKDENKRNNDPDNLEVVTRAEHARIHWGYPRVEGEITQ